MRETRAVIGARTFCVEKILKRLLEVRDRRVLKQYHQSHLKYGIANQKAQQRAAALYG
jgi:hypothetical protein